MTWQILTGDALTMLRTLPDASVQCCVTSPPYFGLRDYGHTEQIGLEQAPAEYVARLVAVFEEVKRVLKDDGTCWINIGDSYASPGNKRSGEGEVRNLKTDKFHGGTAHLAQRRTTGDFRGFKPKDLLGIPWRLAFALQDAGWWLRQDIIWQKPNPMPESVTDRCTKAHEYVFLLTKRAAYFYDADAIAEPAAKGAAGSEFASGKTAIHQLGRASTVARIEDGTRNKRSVWTVATEKVTLRQDLTDEQRTYVVNELLRRGLL